MRSIPFAIFIFSFSFSAFGQDLWVVSNDPSYTQAHFDNIQEAVDSASHGDKIYVAGSNTPYDLFEIDKKLHLIGTGFWKIENGVMDENVDHTRIDNSIYVKAGGDSSIVEGFSALRLVVDDADHV